MKTNKLRQSYFLYLFAISLAGLIVVIFGLSKILLIPAKTSFLLIVGLAVLADIFATSSSITNKEFAFEVGTAVSMALIPLYSPEIAALSAAACAFSIWLIFPQQKNNNKRNWEQLSFNAGMLSIVMLLAGIVFINVQQVLGANTITGQIIPWLAAAIVYDQLNFWLLMGIIRLKQGTAVKPFTIWRENLWAVPINIIILSAGGGVLAFAANQLGLIGIFVFFLPIVLSAYAFRLYVNHMQEHMNNLENIVTQRTEELQKVMQEKDAFLAVLTHDMKSPLTSIHMYASMLKEFPQSIQQKPHMIDAVLHGQEALTDIVNNILELEQLKADGQVPMKKTGFDFAVVAEKVLSVVQVQAESKSIELTVSGFDRHAFVYADQNHMERILNNLVSNAIKYTAINGRVSVILTMQDNQLILQVQDSGFGIPAEELPYVFDRFHRVVSHRKLAPGTGLGLAITKALVEAHEGKIEVTSEEGKGSCFSTYLPVLPQLPQNQPNLNKLIAPQSKQHAVNAA